MSEAPYHRAGGGGPMVVQGQLLPASVFNNGAGNGHKQSSQTASTKTSTSSSPQAFRDVVWAILFYVHLGVIGYLTATFSPEMIAVVAGGQGSGNSSGGGRNRLLRFLEESNNDDGGTSTAVDIDPEAVLFLAGVSAILGFVISTLALGFMVTCAEPLIRMALWFNIILFGALAVLALLGGSVGVALMCLVMFAISACYAWSVWARVPFAASNLVTAVTAVKANLGVAFFAYTNLIVLFLWSTWWSVAAISTIFVTSDCNADGQCASDVNMGVLFLFFVSFYWTIQVISNVMVVTTAGVVGTWWHVPQEASSCCSRAVRESYCRSITTSFGSICLGSLIVAIIQAIKEIVHSMRENGDGILICLAECLLGCIESMVEYFNKWAFCYVGLYGQSFMEAGTSVMQLFRSRGWTSIITDSMVDTVLFMVSLGVGFLTAIVAVVAGLSLAMTDSGTLGTAFVIGFFLGYAICATLFSVVGSATNTVIICYAEAPNEFQANHPELSERMRTTWRQAWPGEFRY